MDNLFLFNEKKLTQSTAFFLYKAKGRLAILKLMKLLYLSERESFRKYHRPLIGDSLISMKNGPILSMTLNFINGEVRQPCLWNEWISDRSNHEVALKDPSLIRDEDDLLELSDNDIKLLNSVWDKFGHLTRWELVDWTHEHCSEWHDPGASSYPIQYAHLFKALNLDKDLQQHIIDDMETEIRLKKAKVEMDC